MEGDLTDFPQLAFAVSRALLKEATTDPEVFSLFGAGLLLGSQSPYLRGIGAAVGTLFLVRRADQYMTVIDSKLALLVRVICEGEPTR